MAERRSSPSSPPEEPLVSTREAQVARVGDLLGGTGFGLLALFVIRESLRLPRRGTLGLLTGAGFTPLLLGGVVLVLSLVVAATALRAGAHRQIGAWARSLVRQEEFRRWLFLAAITGVYVAFVGTIHFLLLNFVYLVVMFAYLRAGKAWQIVVYATVGAFLASYAIPWLFEMPVP